MRVTNSTITSTFLANFNRLLERLGRHQTELTTGKKVNKPSDDLIGTSRLLYLRSCLKSNEQYLRNIGDAGGLLSFTENVLSDLNSIFVDLKGIALQGASETMTPDDRKALAYQVNGHLERLLSNSNSKFKGVYIFGGTQTQVAPYVPIRDDSGEIVSVSSSGDTSGAIQREIGESEFLQVNVAEPEDLTGFFEILIDLRESLRADDTVGIENSIGNIDQGLDKILELRAQVGAKINRLETAENRLQSDNLSITRILSETGDVDITEAIMNLQREQSVYQAALAAGARIIQPSLMDFLGG